MRTDIIHNIEELEGLVNTVGFLPLFTCQIPGFSVEEHTDPSSWWTGDEVADPWEWRVSASRRGNIAYGKFFDGMTKGRVQWQVLTYKVKTCHWTRPFVIPVQMKLPGIIGFQFLGFQFLFEGGGNNDQKEEDAYR